MPDRKMTKNELELQPLNGKLAEVDERIDARARLLERLRRQPPLQIERPKRDDLYD